MKNNIKTAAAFAGLLMFSFSYGTMCKFTPEVIRRSIASIAPIIMQNRTCAQVSQGLRYYQTKACFQVSQRQCHHQFEGCCSYCPGTTLHVWHILKTDYIDKERDFLSLFKECHTGIIAEMNNKIYPASWRGADQVYAKYKKIYEENYIEQLPQSIERFHQVEFLDIKNIESVSEMIKNGYLVFYDNYKQHPECFYSYYNLAACINDLLNFTSHYRNLSEYIWKYKSKYEIEKTFKLKHIQYKNDVKAAFAYYSRQDNQMLNFSERFFEDLCLSQQAFTLLHEIEHTTQDLAMITWDPFEDQMNVSIHERGADSAAASQIKCEICLKIEQLQRKLYPINKPGYFNSCNFDAYIERNKDNRCKAHSCDTKELEQALLNQDMCKVKQIDNAIGTLYDRLPSVA